MPRTPRSILALSLLAGLATVAGCDDHHDHGDDEKGPHAACLTTDASTVDAGTDAGADAGGASGDAAGR